jgi:hypothetical protein
MTNKVYVGDVGTVITLDTGIDLTSGTVSVEYQKPDGVGGVWAGSIAATDSGSSHGVRYTTIAGDLDLDGEWKLQSHAVLPTGEWSGETATMAVYKKFG